MLFITQQSCVAAGVARLQRKPLYDFVYKIIRLHFKNKQANQHVALWEKPGRWSSSNVKMPST